jgi:predicted DNA binding CopG/RHH family protein
MSERRATNDELAEEAKALDSRQTTPAGWVDTPEAIPRFKESTAISLRLPTQMVTILKRFAERSGVGYQVLMKRWLDERIRQEWERIREERERLERERAQAERPMMIKLVAPTIFSQAASFDASSVTNVAPSSGE